MDDYLFMQGLLIERVKSAVPGLGSVGSLFKIDDVARQSAKDPACWIIYCGDKAGDDLRRKNAVTQYWAVLLATRRPDIKTTGECLGRLIGALSDWAPPEESGVLPLVRSQDSLPVDFDNGTLLFPLLFEARFIWPRKTLWKQP